MLDSYDEISFKAVTYPVAVELYKLADELTTRQVKEDCEDNCLFLIDWIEKLDKACRSAHQSVEGYIAPLGYHVVEAPELEIPENL